MSLILRNLVYWLVLALVTPLFFLALFLTAPLPRRMRHVFGESWARFLLWMLVHVVGLKYRVVGAENIPATPSVICSKHQSGWETLALQAIFPQQVWVAKKELLWIPFLGWGLASISTISGSMSNWLSSWAIASRRTRLFTSTTMARFT